MIIEYELQGSRCLHKGIFDTTGFWVRYETQTEENSNGSEFVTGYKLYSHFSFSFFHEEKEIVDIVYQELINAIQYYDYDFVFNLENVGYIKKLD